MADDNDEKSRCGLTSAGPLAAFPPLQASCRHLAGSFGWPTMHVREGPRCDTHREWPG